MFSRGNTISNVVLHVINFRRLGILPDRMHITRQIGDIFNILMRYIISQTFIHTINIFLRFSKGFVKVL